MKTSVESGSVNPCEPNSPQVVLGSRKAVVDRLGEIEERLLQLNAEAKARTKPLVDERQKLEAEALSWFENVDADQSANAEGEQFLLTAGKRERQRKVTDPLKLFRMTRLKIGEFLKQFCSIKLQAIDKFIPEEKHSLFLSDERTGQRTLSVVRKQPAAIGPAAKLAAGSSAGGRKPEAA